MASLDPTLRSALEKAVVEARGKAEDGARAALDVLAVNRLEGVCNSHEGAAGASQRIAGERPVSSVPAARPPDSPCSSKR